MIGATTFLDRGLVRLAGGMPNGPATVTRLVDGQPPFQLRGSPLTVTLGGLLLEDSEAPLSLPLQYRTQVTTTERKVQTNYVRTPTFLHGQQSWLPGVGRTMGITADATAHSAQVGTVTGYPAGASPVAPPTYVGSVSTAVNTTTSYTLTPPTGGGTAIATNDWMVLVHNQLAAAATPTASAGWTQLHNSVDGTIRMTIWARKRLAGDTGVTVTVGTGAASIGSLLWVRGAIDEKWLSTAVVGQGQGGSTVTVGPAYAIRPTLAVTAVAARTASAVTQPTTGDVAGPTWRTTGTSVTSPDDRSLVTATGSSTFAGPSAPAVVTYADNLVEYVGVQIAFQSNNTVSDRVLARAPISALVSSADPYLVTGRFRFTSINVRTWQDLKTQFPTWQGVKDANANWLAVRGAAAQVDSTFLQLFVTITNPSGTDLITPVLAISSTDASTGTWIDFSAYFTVGTTVPDGSELRLVHGVTDAEYDIQWYLDEIGITGADDLLHDTLYWFDGDTPVPPDPQNFRWPGEIWTDVSHNATIVWTGTVGNSTSVFTAPSTVAYIAKAILTEPDVHPSEPVLLSDPVESALAAWVGLLPYSDATYPATRTLHDVMERPDPLATHSVRGLQSGTLNFFTSRDTDREQVLEVFASGRPLLLRSPYREYPENDWYLSLGDLVETRPLPNQRELMRSWSVPYTRINRPAGIIAVSSAAKWQDVKDLGTWEDVKDKRADWLDVLLTLPGSA